MVFFNDPVLQPDHVGARGAHGARDARRASRASPRAGRGWATTSAWASASRPATPRSAGSASRAATTTAWSARRSSSPRASARRPRRARSCSIRAPTPRSRSWSSVEPVGELQLKGFSRPIPTVNVDRICAGDQAPDRRRSRQSSDKHSQRHSEWRIGGLSRHGRRPTTGQEVGAVRSHPRSGALTSRPRGPRPSCRNGTVIGRFLTLGVEPRDLRG